MRETNTYPLPRSLKQVVEGPSREDGTSINQFVATAVAEKISRPRVLFSSEKAHRFRPYLEATRRQAATPGR
jgi:hypothetical protein